MLEDSERVSRSNLASMNDELVGLKKRLVETEAASRNRSGLEGERASWSQFPESLLT